MALCVLGALAAQLPCWTDGRFWLRIRRRVLDRFLGSLLGLILLFPSAKQALGCTTGPPFGLGNGNSFRHRSTRFGGAGIIFSAAPKSIFRRARPQARKELPGSRMDLPSSHRQALRSQEVAKSSQTADRCWQGSPEAVRTFQGAKNWSESRAGESRI